MSSKNTQQQVICQCGTGNAARGISRSAGRIPHFAALAVAAWVGVAAVPALAQPANDTFTNAVVITGASGSTSGSNLNATREAGEPPHYYRDFSVPTDTSVWFNWTAPSNGLAVFDTFGSTFDTILAVYVGDSVGALSEVASDDDSGFGLTSMVLFQASAGTTYHITVTGYFNDVGFYLLSWQMPSVITTNVPPLGPNEIQYEFPSYAVNEAAGLATINVVYGGGAAGPVSADWFTIDGAGTAVPGVDYLPASGTVTFAPGQTNRTITVQIVDNALVNSNKTIVFGLTNATGGAVFGALTNTVVTILDDEARTVVSTAGEFNFSASAFTVSEYESQRAPTLENQVRNRRDVQGAVITVNRSGPATGRVLVDYYVTNVFFTNYFITTNGTFTNFSAAAVPTSGTLVFDDYQMSTNFVVTVRPLSFPFGVSNAFSTAASIPMSLANPRPFPATNGYPGENPFVVAPRLGTLSNATLRIQAHQFPDTFFIERAYYRGDEYASTNATQTNNRVITINVIYNRVDDKTVRVGIRQYQPARSYEFPLAAGSDYTDEAEKTFADTPHTDGAQNTPNPQDYIPIDTTLTFPGPGSRRQTLDITIPDDKEVEFNEDIQVEIYWLGSPEPTPEMNGFPSRTAVATATILCDDPPAGMADRDWNPYFITATDPPLNRTPGANGPVNGVAVQDDQKSVFVGDFTAYNSTPRKGVVRVNYDGSVDATFQPGTGADSVVHAVALHHATTNVDAAPLAGKIVIAGGFLSYNGVQANHIARLNSNGSLDTTFRPGAGANGPIYSLDIQEDGKLLIAGAFTMFNSIPRNHLARLNRDGSLDASFDPGTGPNDIVWAVTTEQPLPPLTYSNSISGGGTEEVRTDIETFRNQGTVTLIYNFLSIPDSLRVYYEGAKIFDSGFTNSPTGPTTVQFNYGPGTSTRLTVVVNEGGNPNPGTAWDYSLQIDSVGGAERILIGGDFTSVNGVRLGHVARLFANGTVDGSFNPGGGVDGPVYALGTVGATTIIGGDFHNVDFRRRDFIARLGADGSLDTGFFPGAGFDAPVFAITMQSDGKPLIGGLFKQFNQVRRVGLTRLNLDGTIDTSFMDTAYNQFAGIPRTFSFEPRNFIRSIALDTNGDLMVGGSFTNIGGNMAFDTENVGIPIAQFRAWTRQEKIVRYNVSRVYGGYTRGPGNVQYAFPQYTTDENMGIRYVTTRRINGRLGTASGLFGTTNSEALASSDYTGTKSVLTWPEYAFVGPRSAGYPGVNYLAVPILEDDLIEGDETLLLGLDTPVGSINLGGEIIPLGAGLAISEAPLTIVDNDFNHGAFAYQEPYFTVNESGGSGVVSIIRTNGASGPVTVDYFILNGSAVAGLDYTNATRGTLTFPSGVTNQTITIPIINDLVVEADETIRIVLTNATGGAVISDGLQTLPTSTLETTLVIIDDDYVSGRINFSALAYATNEGAGLAFITVGREGGLQGPISVDLVVTNGSPSVGTPALAGTDFVGFVTNLAWVNGDTTPRTIAVPLIDNLVVEGSKYVSLSLTNARAGGVLDTNAIGSRGRATLEILNDDNYGEFSFNRADYDADENGTNITITVVRRHGVAGTVQVEYTANTGTAIDGVDYLATTGTLVFGPGEVSKSFSIVLLDDTVGDGNKTVDLVLANPVNATLGDTPLATLTIIDDESFNIPAGTLDSSFSTAGGNNAVYQLALQPDGRILAAGDFTRFNNITRNRLARIYENGDLDPAFNVGPGPNAPVRAMILQPDGRILIGGFFTQVQGTNRNHIARLLTDGTLDSFFEPGAGADNTVYAMALDDEGKIVIGGSFNAVNGISRPSVAVLNTNGTLNTYFDPGLGADGIVYAVAVQLDGKILIGGNFTTVNNIGRMRLARLLPNGVVDPTFDPGLGADAAVRAITVQPDGRILVGGSFTSINGAPRNYLARLNSDGSLDSQFLGTLSGGDNAVYGITLQADSKIIVVGDFTKFNDVTRNRITRLNQNGKTDPTINFGQGANSFIAQAIIQPDRKIVIGGGFTRVQGEPRNYVARLHGGSVAGPGELQFSTPTYTATENAGEVVITVLRAGGTTGDVEVDFATSNLTAEAGLDYQAVSGRLQFPEGEVRKTFIVPVLDDGLVEPAETVNLSLANPSGGAALGVIPEATLTILSDDSVLTFVTPAFSVSEAVASGYAPITVIRLGTTNSSVSVDYFSQDGSATAGLDYTNVSGTLTFAPGETNKVFIVPILQDTLVEGNETIQLALTNASSGVQFLYSTAALTIVDDDFAPGLLAFSSSTYWVNEYETNVVITVIRTNGSSGIISVDYSTSPGTAHAGEDYLPAIGTLTFADGETVKTFNIPILPDYLPEEDETLGLNLANATGGAVITNSSATLTIINNNLINGSFTFNATNYTVAESNLVVALTVFRNFGATGNVAVSYMTIDGTATAGSDFVAVTNTLTWTNDETAPKTVLINLVNDDIVELTESFNVILFNPAGKATLGLITNALVIVRDDDFGPGNLGFITNSFLVNENGTNAFIGIGRTFGQTGDVAIDLATVSGGSAVAGRDYPATNVTLVFSNGVTNLTFQLPVFDNLLVEGNKSVRLALSNPRNLTTPTNPPSTNGQIIAAVLTIVENDPLAGSVDASFAGLNPDAPVNVVLFQTNNNKLLVGGDFTQFNGVSRAYVARFNPSGTLDASFDAAQVVNGPIYALALQPDGRALVGGAFTNFGVGKPSFLARLDESGAPDTNFLAGLIGVDNAVFGLALQSDGKVVAGGAFTGVNGSPRQYIARLEANGVLDPNFLIGEGPDAPVRVVRVQEDGRIMIAGEFTRVSGRLAGHVLRLNQDGSIDTSFNSTVGANGVIRDMVLQRDGRTVIAGAFTTVNGQPRPRIARLNADGSLDSTFNPGPGPDEFVNGLALQPDGRILVVGGFTTFSGVPRNRIVRLNRDGTVDDSINFGAGANNYINSVAVQTDRKILIGGGFTEFNGAPRKYLARLNGGENVGVGEFVFSAASYSVLESGTNVTVTVRRLIGSSNTVSVAFTTANGTAQAGVHYAPTNGVIVFGPGETVATFTVRVIDDAQTNADRTVNLALSNPTGGATLGVPAAAVLTLVNDDAVVGLAAATFSVSENAGTAVVTVERLSSTVGVATVQYFTSDGSANDGADYVGQAGTLLFTNGQRLATFSVPILDDSLVEGNETVNLTLTNATGAGLGLAATTLTIVDDDRSTGLLMFSQVNFNVSEQATQAVVTVQRQGGTAGSASVQFQTSDGTATAGLDYRGTNGLLVFADGEIIKTFTVPILDDRLVEGAETINLTLSGATGGTLGQSIATLTILADEAIFEFAQTNFVVAETNTNAVITVIRTGGGTGTNSVRYFTYDGTASNGLDYLGTNGTLIFAPGQTTNAFTVPILSDALGEGDEWFGLALTNAVGEAVLGTNRLSIATITDDDISFRFENPAYAVNETSGSVNVQVFRVGLTNGAVSVNFATSDGTAIAGSDYIFTSRRLAFAPGQTNALVTIPILDDLLGEGLEYFYVNLDSPTNGTTLGQPSQSRVEIVDNEDTLFFAQTAHAVDEGATNVTVTVQRAGGAGGFITVLYATSNLTATAGLDYTNTTGQLNFTPFEFTKDIVIPIIDDTLAEGDETFAVKLYSPGGGAAVVDPAETVVTILDNDAVVQFVSATNSVAEEVTPAVIEVQRLGGTNALVQVDYFSTNGTATAGVDYQPVAGTLYFLPGQTNLTIDVPIIDDLLIEGNETVSLQLFNVTNAILGVRSNTLLTIIDTDASILVPSGMAIVSESIPPANGVIDSNETVTVNFGLRNVGNVDTLNLQATLLATNGIQPQSPATKSYGVVAAGGNTVSRAFTFKAVGPSGARLAAVFQLMDGANNLGQVSFPFTLGRGTSTYTNTGAITIISPTNGAPALPYPSVINVSGVTGTISKVTLTLHNLSHGYPSDIDIMLVGPSGQKVVIMSDAGGSYPLNNVTLTFDDAASAAVPFSSQISSGTYRPINYGTADSWPPPAPGGPYDTALSAFNGTSPAGDWALYVVDDDVGAEGNIAGGWSLRFSISDVITPAADLAIRVTDSPDPVVLGTPLNYALQVTNFGPASATGVVVTNPLPAGLTFVSASASQGSCAFAAGVLTCDLGTLASGGAATITLATHTTLSGLITDAAGVAGNEADFNPADNLHSAKTTVTPLTMNAGRQGTNLVIAWPKDVPGVTLESSDTLASGSWTPVGATPAESGGMKYVVISPTEVRRFYRLNMAP